MAYEGRHATATRWRSSRYPGSGIDKLEDIKGKKLAFTTETSNSGYKAPPAILRDKFKLEAGKDYRAGVLRQARQLDPRRRQQGLSRPPPSPIPC